MYLLDELRVRGRDVVPGPTIDVVQILGIVNVTPDSFSDGGRYLDASAAVERGLQLIRDGAGVIDIGGESTRPGARPVGADEEQRRVLPVVEALVGHGVEVSIDTRNARTATLAVRAGVSIVNDVSGGTHDPSMIGAVADAGVDYVCMDWGGGADASPPPGPIAGVVLAALAARRDGLVARGIDPERIILDPGLGFGKSDAQNWELVGALRRVCDLGPRVLVGHSRKRFIGALLPPDAVADVRDAASAAVSALCAAAGVWGVRVHDARSTVWSLATVATGAA